MEDDVKPLAEVLAKIETINPAGGPATTSNGNQRSTRTLARSSRLGSDCPDCGGAGFYRVDVPVGHPDFGQVFRCTNQVHQDEQLGRLAQVSGLRPEDLKIRLADIKVNRHNRAMIEAGRRMMANPYGFLYIWGNPGNGKTDTLMAIVNAFNRRGDGPAVYTKFPTVIDYVRDAYAETKRNRDRGETSSTYRARFDELLAIKCLAIDEMDKARETAFQDEFRFDFLDERYRQAVNGETVTIFAGNKNPAELPDMIYDRIRFGKFQIVQNTAPSARPHIGK